MAAWSYLKLASFGGVISLYKRYVFERRAMQDEEGSKGSTLPDEGAEERRRPQRKHALHARLEAEEARRLHLEDSGRGAGNRPRARVAHQEAPIVHGFTALALCYMRLVKSEDAREDAAERLQALRRRFMAHRGYFSKQGELKNGLDMLSEIMDRAAGRLSCP